LKVYWDKDPSRTDCLIEYLKDNPEDRQKLFSDSSQDTKAESRKRRVAKGSKSAFYTKIANAVFSVDDDKSVREDFERDPGKYGKSVENCISTLKIKYRDFNAAIGQTGAGLKYEDVEEDSELANLIGKLLQEFPYWKDLHGFWRTLPNFNLHTVSPEPGQDLQEEAMDFLHNRREAR
ncbi:hypothetical protein FIBSPDRAFT_699951, partial [Athelia psychrophila]